MPRPRMRSQKAARCEPESTREFDQVKQLWHTQQEERERERKRGMAVVVVARRSNIANASTGKQFVGSCITRKLFFFGGEGEKGKDCILLRSRRRWSRCGLNLSSRKSKAAWPR